jgi:acetate kinase
LLLKSFILCLDAGSSSLKFALYDAARGDCALVRAGEVPAREGTETAVRTLWEQLEERPAAVGHRIVFGGRKYVEPTRAKPEVLRELELLVPIEPLHLRPELDLVYAVARLDAAIPQILCFDTAFHRQMPDVAKRYPLPRNLDPLVERYGFHGLSYEYVVSALGGPPGRTVIAHLGSGASLCALIDGAPIDTTMGFSALGGLMMGTRPGDLDPGVLLWLIEAHDYNKDRLTELLYRRSGLLGVSGSSSDMKTLLEALASDENARQAVELFTYQLVKHLGAMIAVLGGLDTLVFTGGIGERASAIRAAACRPLAYLGISIDAGANARNEAIISSRGPVTVRIVPTNENLMIARHVLEKFTKPSQG